MSDTKEVGKPIPFIISEKGQGFKITQEAIEFLSTLNSKRIGVVSVVGKYRTGKSFLLNRILLQQKPESGFAVGPTVNSCTKGIWLWSIPVKSENPDEQDLDLLVMDTEGFGGVNENQNHDTRIFIFSILLSSMFIYNSTGSIDENALQSLSLVVNIAKEIQKTENASMVKNPNKATKFDRSFADRSLMTYNSIYNFDESRQNLASKNQSMYLNNELDEETIIDNFPSFLWVIRDFALELIDSFGNPISSKKYLELALEQVKGNSESAESKNKVRKLLKHFFKQRDCLTLVRPVEKESDLQKLDTLSDSALRLEFLTQAKKTRKHVLTKTPVKKINKTELDGVGFLHYAQAIVVSINQGKAPSIDSAWNYVMSFQHEKLLRNIYSGLKGHVGAIQSPEDIERILEKIDKEFEKEKLGGGTEFDDIHVQETRTNIMNEIREELEQNLSRYRKGLKTNLKADTEKVFTEMLNAIVASESLSMEKVEAMVDSRYKSLVKKFFGENKEPEKWFKKFFNGKKVDLYSLVMRQIENQAHAHKQEVANKLKDHETLARESQRQFTSKITELETRTQLDQVKIDELERQSNKFQAIIESYKEEKERISFKLRNKEEELAKIEFELLENKEKEISELKLKIYHLESVATETQNNSNKEVMVLNNRLNHMEKENVHLKDALMTKEAENEQLRSVIESLQRQITELKKEASNKPDFDEETEMIVSKLKYKDLKEKVKSFEELKFNYEKIIHEINEEKHIIQCQFEILKDNYEEQKTRNMFLLNEIKNRIDNLEAGGHGNGTSPLNFLQQDFSAIRNNKSEISMFPVINNSSKKIGAQENKSQSKYNRELCADIVHQDDAPETYSVRNQDEDPRLSKVSYASPNSNQMSITIAKCIARELSGKENGDSTQKRTKLTEYTFEVRNEGRKWNVTRRFRDFCEMLSLLQAELPSVEMPEACKEILTFMGDLWNLAGSKGFPHEDRQRLIEKALKDISNIEEVREHHRFKTFIGLN